MKLQAWVILALAVSKVVASEVIKDAPFVSEIFRRAAPDPSGAFADACSPSNPPSGTGFAAIIYQYTQGDLQDSESVSYLQSQYKSLPVIATVNGVTNIDFQIESSTDSGTIGTVYGQTFGITNFVLALTGYFYATETGLYSMTLSADDSALVEFGAGTAFSCCNSHFSSTTSYSMLAFWDSPADTYGVTSNQYQLVAGMYYPIHITYINAQGSAEFSFSMVSPSGEQITQFSDVYQFQDTDSPCLATTTVSMPWTETYTTTTTVSANTASGNIETVEVLTPGPRTTQTSHWSNSETETFTSYPEDSTGTVTVEVVEPYSTTTMTVLWSGSQEVISTIAPAASDVTETVVMYLPSLTTTAVQWTGADVIVTTMPGSSNEQGTVQVLLPDPRITATTHWTGTISSTYTSYPADSVGTVSVVVEDPYAVVTTTALWTGESTATVTYFPPNNDQTATVVVYFPDATTIADYWTGTEYSITTLQGSSGGTTTVEILIPDARVTETTHWTLNTISTYTSYPTDYEGTVEIIVETPFPLTTTTQVWTGTDSITKTLFPKQDSGTAIVEVLVPGMTTVTKEWTGTEYGFTTLPATSDGTTTVQILIPDPRTTITSYGTNADSTVLTLTPNDPSGTVTVVVEEPYKNTHETLLWTGTETSTVTKYPAVDSGTETIEILVPGVTTEAEQWTGDIFLITTLTPTSGGTTTVEILMPDPRATLTSHWTETTDSHTTYYPSDSPGMVVIVNDQPYPLTTRSQLWSGASNSKTTLYPNNNNGTAIVEDYIPDRTTVSAPWTGTELMTYTLAAAEDEISTVQVLVPDDRTTETIYWTKSEASASTLYPTATGGEIVVEHDVPLAESTRTHFWTKPYSSTTTIWPSNNTGIATVNVFAPGDTTISQVWTGTYTEISTLSPNLGGTTTIRMEIPEVRFTSTTFWSSVNTATLTLNSASPSGTLVVEIEDPYSSTHSFSPVSTYLPETITISETWTGSSFHTTTLPAQSTPIDIPAIILVHQPISDVTRNRTLSSSERTEAPLISSSTSVVHSSKLQSDTHTSLASLSHSRNLTVASTDSYSQASHSAAFASEAFKKSSVSLYESSASKNLTSLTTSSTHTQIYSVEPHITSYTSSTTKNSSRENINQLTASHIELSSSSLNSVNSTNSTIIQSGSFTTISSAEYSSRLSSNRTTANASISSLRFTTESKYTDPPRIVSSASRKSWADKESSVSYHSSSPAISNPTSSHAPWLTTSSWNSWSNNTLSTPALNSLSFRASRLSLPTTLSSQTEHYGTFLSSSESELKSKALSSSFVPSSSSSVQFASTTTYKIIHSTEQIVYTSDSSTLDLAIETSITSFKTSLIDPNDPTPSEFKFSGAGTKSVSDPIQSHFSTDPVQTSQTDDLVPLPSGPADPESTDPTVSYYSQSRKTSPSVLSSGGDPPSMSIDPPYSSNDPVILSGEPSTPSIDPSTLGINSVYETTVQLILSGNSMDHSASKTENTLQISPSGNTSSLQASTVAGNLLSSDGDSPCQTRIEYSRFTVTTFAVPSITDYNSVSDLPGESPSLTVALKATGTLSHSPHTSATYRGSSTALNISISIFLLPFFGLFF